MRPFAVWLEVRAPLRRSWRGAAVLAVLIGVTAGVIAASVTSARRGETAYDRMLLELNAPDALLFADCAECGDRDALGAFYEARAGELLADPAVADVGVVMEQYLVLRTAAGTILGPFPEQECGTGAGELSVVSSSDWPGGEPPARIVDGRLPSAQSIDEIALASVTAERAGVRVGDRIDVTDGCHGAEGQLLEPIALRVVGIFVGVFDIHPPGSTNYFENVYASPALERRIGLSRQGSLAIWFEPGRTMDDLDAELTERYGFVFRLDDHAALVSARLDPDALGLRLLAFAASIAGLAVLGQLLARHIRSMSADHAVLRALGAQRRDLWVIGLSHGLVVASGAAVVASVSVFAVTPFVPLGEANEIRRGLRETASISAIAVTAIAVAALTAMLSAGPAWSAARARSRRSAPHGLAGRFADGLRLTPAASWGVRFALGPARGEQPAAVRSGLGAIGIAVAAVAGVMTFGAGLEHLRSTPRLVGWDWDLMIFAEQGPGEDLAVAIAASDDVERSSGAVIFGRPLALASDPTEALAYAAFETGAHAVGPVVLDGRAPEGPDEVLLAPRLAARAGVEIGDIVELVAYDPLAAMAEELGVDPGSLGIEETRSVALELVGIGVLPVPQLDLGTALTMDGLRRVYPQPARDDVMRVFAAADPAVLLDGLSRRLPPDVVAGLSGTTSEQLLGAVAELSDAEFGTLSDSVAVQVVFVDLARGADLRAFLEALRADGLVTDELVDEMAGADPPTSEDIVDLDLGDVAWIPATFGILMGFTAIAVLAHLVASGARARRRDIAILRALGFDRRAVRATIAWQALTLVIVSAVIAIPVGVAVGRAVWRQYATGLRIVPEPVTPWALMGLLLVAMVVVGLLAAAIPARRAMRHDPLATLRTE